MDGPIVIPTGPSVSVGSLALADRVTYRNALRSSHAMRVRVMIRDRNEKVIGALTQPDVRVQSGEIQIDTTSDVTRQLSLTIDDTAGVLEVFPNSPRAAGMYVDNFISVSYGVWVDAVGKWVDASVFWGPITQIERSGAAVSIEASGKELLARQPFTRMQTTTIQKGVPITDAVQAIMDPLGETRYALPVLPRARMRNPVSVHPQDDAWDYVKQLAASADRFLYYNGAGELVLARRTPAPLWEWAVGVDVISYPAVTFDAITDTRNVVQVTGSDPPGKASKLARVSVPADPGHPLSSKSLARNGKPRWMADFETADHLWRAADVKSRAASILRRKLSAQMSASFTTFPIPAVNEWDLCQVAGDDGWVVQFELTNATIPLTPDATMSVGVNVNVSASQMAAYADEARRMAAWAT
jgi:hypothetical protein